MFLHHECPQTADRFLRQQVCHRTGSSCPALCGRNDQSGESRSSTGCGVDSRTRCGCHRRSMSFRRGDRHECAFRHAERHDSRGTDRHGAQHECRSLHFRGSERSIGDHIRYETRRIKDTVQKLKGIEVLRYLRQSAGKDRWRKTGIRSTVSERLGSRCPQIFQGCEIHSGRSRSGLCKSLQWKSLSLNSEYNGNEGRC